jgi:hypothetical protein
MAMTTGTSVPPAAGGFEPKHPTMAATGLLTLWIAILSLPAWTGKFLAGPYSDQYDTGYAFRHWLASEIKRTGHVPLWNPELFGGLPFVGAMHGDIFYPTSLLRLVLPTGTAMNLGFLVHYVLAGLFAYLLLRRLRVSWAGAVTGGLAYQLSGVIGTYVSPGHDGKLFVTTLLPLALIGLLLGMRERRLEGYGVLALTVGLALVSPHAQMTYYLLIAAGIFALYLAFGEPVPGRAVRPRLWDLAMALGAVVLGFGIGMIQIMPFFEYLPYSPRAEGYHGFEGATSFAIPWSHVPEFFVADFAGNTPDGTYWGPNGGGLKLHSEYLGLPVLALAAFGAADRGRRRLILWLAGLGLLFLLISLGAGTPFYRAWWAVMPFVKQTRAPGMALYVVALVLAILAGIGLDRVFAGGGKRHRGIWIGAGAGVAVLAAVGAFGAIAESLAQAVELAQARPSADTARRAAAAIRLGGMLSGAALVVLGLLALAAARRKLPPAALALAVPLLVGADLWRNAAGFWTWSAPPTAGLYAGDSLTAALGSIAAPGRAPNGAPVPAARRSAGMPFRVLNSPNAYPGSSLMAYRIPQILGYHGNELHAFDELLGGRNVWSNLGRGLPARRPKVWDLYAVRFVLASPQEQFPEPLPGFVRRATTAATATGNPIVVFERDEPPAWAWVATAGLKIDDSTGVAAALDPRIDPRALVLLAQDAPVEPPPIDTLPPPSTVAASVTDWAPGRMTIGLETPPAADGYLVVAENWYVGWRATVDGEPAPVLRANVAQLAVPLPAGARDVRLTFESPSYQRGKLITMLSLVAVLALVAAARVRRRPDG